MTRGGYGGIELVAIGDELLDGRTRDLNAYWLGSRLARIGLSLGRVTLVGDARSPIVAALDGAARRARHVLVSGGLGPTSDDRTRDAAADWLSVPLVEDAAILAALEERFAAMGRDFAPTNRRQALFPQGVQVLATEVGTAAGFRVRRGDCTLDFVPGVPRELRWFVDRYWIELVGDEGAAPPVERRWRFFGLGESEVAARVEALDPGAVSVHYTARFPEVHLYGRAFGGGAEAAIADFDTGIRGCLSDALIGVGEASLAERLGQALIDRGWQITTAESCTGGQIAETITAAAGSSAYFGEAAVTYSNAAKVKHLGVSAQTLDRDGAVSRQTVLEMARGAQARAAAEMALAVSGIAGPSGSRDGKPVGTVDIALATPDGLFHRRWSFLGRSRNGVRTLATWAALTAALWYLEGRLSPDWTRCD